MSLIRLRCPRPRKREIAVKDYVYRTVRPRSLTRDVLRLRVDFFDVVDRRRTRRNFGAVSERQLSSFLWWTAFTRMAVRQKSGFILEYRPTPSAGGRHPVDLMIVRRQGSRWRAWLYEPMTHHLLLLDVRYQLLCRLVEQANQLVSVKRATIIWFVSQPERTASKYVNSESLVWRDAGVLIGHMALVAEALELSFCPLGTTGEPIVSTLLGGGGQVAGVGGCLLGSA